MIKLHLGVIDIPYSYESNKSLASTGDVAVHLEEKYEIMQNFYNLKKKEISEELTKSMVGSLNSILSGANASTHDPFGSASSAIDNMFKQFLSNREIEELGIAGVPTQAAKLGKSSRFKIGKNWRWIKRGKKHIGVPRPSFIDTGLYQASFKSWVRVS